MLKLEVNIVNKERATDLPRRYLNGLDSGIRNAMSYAVENARSRFGTRGNVKSRTGKYKDSIRSVVRKTSVGYVGSLTSDCIYAPVHEFGATIYPKSGEYMRFPINGNWVTLSKVVIPKRPLLGPALQESLSQIEDIIVGNIVKETN